MPASFADAPCWCSARDMFPVECVVRGYLSGSGWKEYKASGSVCGIKLAGRTARIRPVAGADFHARDQGHDRA